MKDNVLLLRPDRAGDAIKSLPVLRALSKTLPHIQFHLLASEHNASLFAFEPSYLVHVLPKNWKKMKKEKILGSLNRNQFVERFEKTISLLADPSEDVDVLLNTIASNERYSVGFHVDTVQQLEGYQKLSLPESTPAKRDESLNIALLLSQIFNVSLSAHTFSRSPILSEEDEQEAVEKMGSKYGSWLGFCPFAGQGNRGHPIRRWEKFIQKVTQEEAFDRYFLFGTPSDYAFLEKLRAASPVKDRIEMCFPSTFRTLGAYLKRLEGVVAIDSGPLHLAQSLGVKSLGILSGGDVQRWFNHLNPGDHLLRRGLFNRFPSVLEMVWAFDRWKPSQPAPA